MDYSGREKFLIKLQNHFYHSEIEFTENPCKYLIKSIYNFNDKSTIIRNEKNELGEFNICNRELKFKIDNLFSFQLVFFL